MPASSASLPARYCGRVQAIEVWNEQNLHYEWGNEPISASRYVQLLAPAYRAIKAACPSMIVVSGAPTPTGAQPPAAIPDFTYLEQMYQAGLKNVLRRHRRSSQRLRQPARCSGAGCLGWHLFPALAY